jgi:hypothetical protein
VCPNAMSKRRAVPLLETSYQSLVRPAQLAAQLAERRFLGCCHGPLTVRSKRTITNTTRLGIYPHVRRLFDDSFLYDILSGVNSSCWNNAVQSRILPATSYLSYVCWQVDAMLDLLDGAT